MKQLTKIFIIVALAFTGGRLNAQTTSPPRATVTGAFINDQSKPVDYATVTLLRAKDSTVVKGTLTNDAGRYVFDKITEGKYIIKGTSVGYQPAFTAAFDVVNGQTNVTAPVLNMTTASRSLQGVNVVASKPLIERKLDRTVMNVENSVLAAGNNALEILERAPGVTVDKDDNISLKGKQGVTVMINDKLTYMSAQQLTTYLRSTDGSNIQSIELITNPSSKYDASGNSGIINIKLKKNKMIGTNGSLTVNGAYGKNFRDNTSLTLNHKNGNLNVFATLTRGDINRENVIAIDRRVDSASKSTYFKQQTNMFNKIHYNNYRFGADYATSKKNTLGFVVNGDYTNEYNDNTGITRLGLTPAAADSYQTTIADMKQTYRSFSANINDKYQIDTLGQEISVDADYSKYRNNSDAVYDTYFFRPDGSTQRRPLFIANQTPSTITIWTQKVDYTLPITKTLKFEAGAKFSSVKTDNDLQAQVDSTGTVNSHQFVNDPTRTNRFVYDEKIAAGYINLGKTFTKTSVQLGLRAENTSSTGDLITYNQVVKRNYLNLFPSLFVNHTLSDKHELGFSYSRRIDRPNYDNLNPFRFYLDQYTYEQGNPFLRPQYTNSFELSYTYNKTINLTLGYSHTTDVSTQVILTDTITKATYQTNLNLNSQDSYNANVNSPFTITKWWTGNINATAFYQKFKSDSLLGGQLNAGKFAYQARLTQNFLFAGFKAEVSGNYQSSLRYGLFDIKPQYSVDAGVSRSFAQKKLNIKFSVSDIFDTRRNNVSSHYQNVNLDVRQKNETRLARLTLTYNFGNSKIKIRQHQSGADDEKGRVKSGN
ncbi:TonB-dependent receptor [Mucilaginibacter achroorhodeus]|uniref:TonB-dependent receptor n=1 Tax=Mucilaginibacter achroorhodeus TaxID=2599294 RepID=A0A563UBJ8_9SPHI|nr:outer membrane beta-barrel family protein [Mucilaginibacter achroorhodeus]TWR28629.1 TonB-dependent receptor [Mucilaginibacter achroorhodeus]